MENNATASAQPAPAHAPPWALAAEHALGAGQWHGAWCTLLEGTDVCFAPVLDMGEAPQHPHNAARASFIDIDGVTQPAPAPRFSRSVPQAGIAPAAPGQHNVQVLADWGWAPNEIGADRH